MRNPAIKACKNRYDFNDSTNSLTHLHSPPPTFTHHTPPPSTFHPPLPTFNTTTYTSTHLPASLFIFQLLMREIKHSNETALMTKKYYKGNNAHNVLSNKITSYYEHTVDSC